MKLDATTQNYNCNFYVTDIYKKTPGEHEHTGLISRLKKPTPVPGTPGTEGVPDSEEEHQGSLFLQEIIKGHATQTLACIVMALFPACLHNSFVNSLQVSWDCNNMLGSQPSKIYNMSCCRLGPM
jgi:hypothetical protein